MTYVNRWSGDYFGWISGGELYTKDGRHVGRLKGRDVHDSRGRYLGELKDDRLVTALAKKGTRSGLAFTPARIKTLPPRVRPMNEQPLDLPDGYEDFPDPDSCG